MHVREIRIVQEKKIVHITLPMYVNTIKEAIKTILSSFTTYNSCEMAAAMRPVPRRAVPVFVMRLGEDGNFSMISSARLEGGTGLVAIERLFIRVR